MNEIGAKLTFIGQIMIITALILKNRSYVISIGAFGTILLMVGLPMLMDYSNGRIFEFSTWVPFYISGLTNLYFTIRLIIIKTTHNTRS